jgi:hypothetical protein
MAGMLIFVVEKRGSQLLAIRNRSRSAEKSGIGIQ